MYDPDDPEDPLEPFDPEDPHVAEDEPELFVVPTNFVAAFTPGQTGTNDLQYYGTFNVAALPLTGGEAYTNKMLLVTVWASLGPTAARFAPARCKPFLPSMDCKTTPPIKRRAGGLTFVEVLVAA